jgi:hypothetical protein
MRMPCARPAARCSTACTCAKPGCNCAASPSSASSATAACGIPRWWRSSPGWRRRMRIACNCPMRCMRRCRRWSTAWASCSWSRCRGRPRRARWPPTRSCWTMCRTPATSARSCAARRPPASARCTAARARRSAGRPRCCAPPWGRTSCSISTRMWRWRRCCPARRSPRWPPAAMPRRSCTMWTWTGRWRGCSAMKGRACRTSCCPLRGIKIAIPHLGQVESLNVAACAAVCFFEQVRQRQARAG